MEWRRRNSWNVREGSGVRGQQTVWWKSRSDQMESSGRWSKRSVRRGIQKINTRSRIWFWLWV